MPKKSRMIMGLLLDDDPRKYEEWLKPFVQGEVLDNESPTSLELMPKKSGMIMDFLLVMKVG